MHALFRILVVSVKFVSQQIGAMRFSCAASAAHFFIIKKGAYFTSITPLGVKFIILIVCKKHTKEDNMFCGKCGQKIPDDATICPLCGAPTENAPVSTQSVQSKQDSDKSYGKGMLKSVLVISIVLLAEMFLRRIIPYGVTYTIVSALCSIAECATLILLAVKTIKFGTLRDEGGKLFIGTIVVAGIYTLWTLINVIQSVIYSFI